MEKVEREIKVIALMISLYCRKKHRRKKKDGLCEDCKNLLEYAQTRRNKCPFNFNGQKKPFCHNCKIHCYVEPYRSKIREVMRFSGPRIIFSHPILSFRHLIETKAEQRKLKKQS